MLRSCPNIKLPLLLLICVNLVYISTVVFSLQTTLLNSPQFTGHFFNITKIKALVMIETVAYAAHLNELGIAFQRKSEDMADANEKYILELVVTDSFNIANLTKTIMLRSSSSVPVAAIFSPTLHPEIIYVCNLLRIACVGYGLAKRLPDNFYTDRYFKFVQIKMPYFDLMETFLSMLVANRDNFKIVFIFASETIEEIYNYLRTYLRNDQVFLINTTAEAKNVTSKLLQAQKKDQSSEMMQIVITRVQYLSYTETDAWRKESPTISCNVSYIIETVRKGLDLTVNTNKMQAFIQKLTFDKLISTSHGREDLYYLREMIKSFVVAPWYMDPADRVEHEDQRLMRNLGRSLIKSVLDFMTFLNNLYKFHSQRVLQIPRILKCENNYTDCYSVFRNHYIMAIKLLQDTTTKNDKFVATKIDTGLYDLGKLLNKFQYLEKDYRTDMVISPNSFFLPWIPSLHFNVSLDKTPHITQKNLDLSIVLNVESPLVMIKQFTDFQKECKNGIQCELIYANGSSRNSVQCCFGIAIDFIFLTLGYPLRLQCEKKFLRANLVAQKAMCDSLPTTISMNEIKVIAKMSSGSAIPLTFLDRGSFDRGNIMSERLNESKNNFAMGSRVIGSNDFRRNYYCTDPYMESSVSIIVMRKEKLSGRSSLTGFLNPFDAMMWLCIVATVHFTAIGAVIYEWLSPYGLTPYGRNRSRVFSFPSALTLCWSVLFSHTVPTKSPKCWSSRFLVNVYAFFCLIFIASYTANLAAFMVEDAELSDIQGIQDRKIQYGIIKIGTVKGSGTEIELAKSQPQLFKFLYFFDSPEDGLLALNKGIIGAFLYETELLSHLIKVQREQGLQFVGKPFGRIGYIISVNKQLGYPGRDMALTLNNLLASNEFSDQLKQKIDLWTKVVPGKTTKPAGKKVRLTYTNFAGPLLLFCFGILFGIITLVGEWVFYSTALPCIRTTWKPICCLPISQRVYRHMYLFRKLEEEISETENVHFRQPSYQAERLQNYRSTRDSLLLSSYTDDFLHDKSIESSLVDGITSSSCNAMLSHFNNRLVFNNADIAVQTDIENVVNSHLENVDAEIRSTSDQFQRDLQTMREKIAHLMRDRERLLWRLAQCEGKSKTSIEQELSEPAGQNKKNIELTHKNKLSSSPAQFNVLSYVSSATKNV